MSKREPNPDIAAVAARIRTMSAAELVALAGLLAGELAAAKVAGGDASLVNDAEVRRRTRLIAAKCESVEFGRTVCCFCLKPSKGRDVLRRHLETGHRDEVRALPASAFPDPSAGRFA